MRPARSAVAESTVHGRTLPCIERLCAEDFLLPDSVLELAEGLELDFEPEPEVELDPVLLVPVTATSPEISVGRGMSSSCKK
jgi:hypothetical protein